MRTLGASLMRYPGQKNDLLAMVLGLNAKAVKVATIAFTFFFVSGLRS